MLDIDGVLNQWDFDQELFRRTWQAVVERRSSIGEMRQFLLPGLIDRLNMLVRHAKCEVVLSSNWRSLFHHSPAEWNATHGHLGFEFNVVDFAVSSKALNRGEQVYQWMQKEGAFLVEAPLVAVALDDDLSIADALTTEHSVLCNPNRGLTPEKALEVFCKLYGIDDDGFCARCMSGCSEPCSDVRVTSAYQSAFASEMARQLGVVRAQYE